MDSTGPAIDLSRPQEARSDPALAVVEIRPHSPEKGRQAWPDAAKGIGILLVIAGHALGGLLDSPRGETLLAYRYVFMAIYAFHMPLFFLLAGLFVTQRLDRDRTGFAISLLTAIALPYFLWSVIQFGAIYAAGSLVNRPVETFWPTIMALPIRTVSQFWFLYVLFVLHVCALAIVPRLGALAFFVVVIAARLALPWLGLSGMLRLSIIHAPFYALGVVLGVDGVRRLLIGQMRDVRLVSLTVAASGVLLATVLFVAGGLGPPFTMLKSPQIAAIAWHPAFLPAALLCAAALIALAARFGGAGLVYLGRQTMPIYVMHVLFIAGMRIALTHFVQRPAPLLILAATLCAGLAGPLAAAALARRAGVARALAIA